MSEKESKEDIGELKKVEQRGKKQRKANVFGIMVWGRRSEVCGLLPGFTDSAVRNLGYRVQARSCPTGSPARLDHCPGGRSYT